MDMEEDSYAEMEDPLVLAAMIGSSSTHEPTIMQQEDSIEAQHKAMFHSPEPLSLEALHPLISTSTSRILYHDLPQDYHKFLPQQDTGIWAEVDQMLRHHDVPVSISSLRRQANKSIIAYTTCDQVSPLLVDPYEWWDVAADQYL